MKKFAFCFLGLLMATLPAFAHDRSSSSESSERSSSGSECDCCCGLLGSYFSESLKKKLRNSSPYMLFRFLT